METAPIILLAYNRPEHVERAVASLLRNAEAAQSDLYIYCDGAKPGTDPAPVERVREIARSVEGFREVHLVMRERNYGLAANVIDSVTQVVNAYGRVIVVEDDPYGRLRFDGGHVLPLKALSDDVVYLGTISKIFAPGLRTGWIVAPKSVLAKINLAKQGTDLCNSVFDQVVVAHYFTDTPWQRTLQKFIKTYRERRDAMLVALEQYFPPEASWTHPEGGLFVWVTLPAYFDTGSMLSEALEAGVTYVPGDSFYPDGKRGKNCMRINFSFETPEHITEAVRRLAAVIEDRLALYRAFIEAGALPSTEHADAAGF